MANSGVYEQYSNPYNEAVHYHRLTFIADYIQMRETEDGEPPDTDTLLEALGLPDEYDVYINEAYEMYYRRGGLGV